MAKRHPTVKALRAAVKDISGAWIRRWKDGTIWAGHTSNTEMTMFRLKATLEAAGFVCHCNGKPGTAGEFIIDVEQPQ